MMHLVKLSVTLMMVWAVFCSAPFAQAYSEYVNYIPNGGKFQCNNCHGSGYSINQFGLDYSHGGHTWNPDLAFIDSDGDGFPNGVELQDPNGEWGTGVPDPGEYSAVTNPGDASSFPGEPTATPTPTGGTPTPTPTASGGCDRTGVTITMPSHLFNPGDVCNCHAIVCNREGHPLEGHPLYVLLDVFGEYFFAPSFNQRGDNYLNLYPEFPEGVTDVTVLSDFTWPDTDSSAEHILWYGAILDPGVTEIIGDLGTFEFGWN